jgi:hypothetical protein
VTLHELATKRQTPLRSLLKPAAISHSDFFEWNPALDTSLTMLPAGYRIKLPPEKVEDFLAAERRATILPARARSMDGAKARPSTAKSTAKHSGKPKRDLTAARKGTQAKKISVGHTRRASVKLAAQ